jgi:hypothetical protein
MSVVKNLQLDQFKKPCFMKQKYTVVASGKMIVLMIAELGIIKNRMRIYYILKHNLQMIVLKNLNTV